MLQVCTVQVVFDRVLSCSKHLSDVLYGTQLDLAKAANLVSATIETSEYALSASQHCAIKIEVQRKSQSRQPRLGD